MTDTANPAPGKDRITLEVSRDGWTNGVQLSINKLDEKGVGWGYRIAGPKFNGSGETLLKRELDQRDVDEIRRYLDAVFPQRITAWVVDGPGPEEIGAYFTLVAAQQDAQSEAESWVRVMHRPVPVFSWEPQGDVDCPDYVLLADGALTGWTVHQLPVNDAPAVRILADGAGPVSSWWALWSEDDPPRLLDLITYDTGPVTEAQARAGLGRAVVPLTGTLEAIDRARLTELRETITKEARRG